MEEFEELVADVFSRRCTSRSVLETITGRWAILALVALYEGPYRFNALRRRVDGVSEKMLSQTLHALERDGMVLRVAETSIPPKVEYSLTELGREAAERLVPLLEWVEERMPQVVSSREEYAAR
ncbi:winged helix-turn-helix transcriptional regulator [Nonomuraea angiospora]|uniref:DNA-binding HxlR family transcriptional regulator n=1 Tax=Nonomuraea angiospora TaxID=46172 RepID=A0ABR9LMV2_9ACTN|nr:helix-turn-helix domain-containing protein [Nonomuraea angiospora]MBE1581989.1 DNA-binding HxlR family transcriptional regulator [Nonomuraea angiospora]MDX3110532.1 helix-turn-helix domain-containing protein [Nonomuraea angiospora]